jgi:hypothetical protein
MNRSNEVRLNDLVWIKNRAINLENVARVELNKRRDLFTVVFEYDRKLNIGNSKGDYLTEEEIESFIKEMDKYYLRSFIKVIGLNGIFYIKKGEINALVPVLDEPKKTLTNIILDDDTITAEGSVESYKERLEYVNLNC